MDTRNHSSGLFSRTRWTCSITIKVFKMFDYTSRAMRAMVTGTRMRIEDRDIQISYTQNPSAPYLLEERMITVTSSGCHL